MARVSHRNAALLGLLGVGLALGLVYAGTNDKKPPLKVAPPAASSPSASTGDEETGSVDPLRQEKDAFAQKALETLRIGGVRGEPRYDAERFRILMPGPDGGEGLILNLTNFFEEYRTAPPDYRTQVLERLLSIPQTPTEPPDSYAQVRPALLPVVRPRAYFEVLSLLDPTHPQAGTPMAVWRPLGEVLAVALVHDLPESMRYLNPDDLKRWGVSFDVAYAHALENLRLLSREPLVPALPGVCMSPWNDSYSPSRLLLDEVLKGCKVRGEPVVVAPSRDVLLVTGSKEEEGLRHVAEMTRLAYEAPRPIDARALRRTAKGWEPFLPERSSPAYPALRLLAMRSRSRDYADQTEQLRAFYEKKGVDLFVAAHMAYENDEGDIRSHATWVKDVDTLLPRADYIAFIEDESAPNATPVLVPWELVVRDASHLLVLDKGLYPERYRLKGFPTKEQFQRWKAVLTATDAP